MTRPPKIITTGGGTGGHLYPAIALLEAFQKLSSPPQLGHIGHPHKIEADKIPALGIPFYGVCFSGLPKNKLWLPFWGLQLLLATFKASLIILKQKPNVIYATGGYVTAPVLLAALLLNIPYIIHEPDAHAGKVNRIFAKKAKAVTAGFEATRSVLKNPHFMATGNPLRGNVGKLSKQQGRHQMGISSTENSQVLLVVGGSQGAQSINQAILDCAQELLKNNPQLKIIHQAGHKNFETCQQQLNVLGIKPEQYQLFDFIENMPAALASADIVIGRSGALSLSEFALSGLPSILIPYPYAAADHQYHNAKAFVDVGAAQLILDKELNSQTLLPLVQALLLEPAKLTLMSEKAKALSKPKATKDIIELLLATV
jgi:UDP-N-acetylglucosamine--N-acetylmuramyl-(pentapeptide) pyrophosphoryl-undecaprenol N-acetylglucosamine transferase